MSFHWSSMKGSLVDCISAIFVEQGRLALSVIVALWIVFRLLGRHEREQRFVPSLAWSFAVFAIGILVFSAGNVFMKRYLLCLLPPLVILSGRALFELVRDQTKVLLPATMGLGLLCLGDLTSPRFNCAYDMSFRQSVLLSKAARVSRKHRGHGQTHPRQFSHRLWPGRSEVWLHTGEIQTVVRSLLSRGRVHLRQRNLRPIHTAGGCPHGAYEAVRLPIHEYRALPNPALARHCGLVSSASVTEPDSAEYG